VLKTLQSKNCTTIQSQASTWCPVTALCTTPCIACAVTRSAPHKLSHHNTNTIATPCTVCAVTRALLHSNSPTVTQTQLQTPVQSVPSHNCPSSLASALNLRSFILERYPVQIPVWRQPHLQRCIAVLFSSTVPKVWPLPSRCFPIQQKSYRRRYIASLNKQYKQETRQKFQTNMFGLQTVLTYVTLRKDCN